MQNSHQVFWEFYNGAMATYGHEKCLESSKYHHAGLLQMPPFVVKLMKNFRKKVCSEIGKKTTILKKWS